MFSRPATPFTFRVGIAIAPNRLPHPRLHDLRMFIWIGDAKNPYPTDREIVDAARLGYTLFQMHRLGTPGEPRPPQGELQRVLETVHRFGHALHLGGKRRSDVRQLRRASPR